MKKLFLLGLLALVLGACAPNPSDDQHAHDHTGIKLQLTAYGEDYELYAEADPFVTGGHCDVLAHFTSLINFKPVGSSAITLTLVTTTASSVTSSEAVTDGIYAFHVHPEGSGAAKLIFDISNSDGESRVVVEGIYIYDDDHEAIHEAEHQFIADPNAIIFTKEQSWKVDFSTTEVMSEPFGQVIKAGAEIRSSANDKVSLVARTSGIVNFPGENIFEGTAVTDDSELFRVNGAGMADNNTHVRYMEARNNYEESKANYERMKMLTEDKIVPESELLEAKRNYETDKVLYESLKENFEGGEQIVKSPVDGYVNEIFVQNGEYVEAGRILLNISQNKQLVLMADVQQKYAASLENILTANIRTVQDKKTCTLEELNGRLSSYGKSVNRDNYLIPVRFEIENTMGLVPGSFVELYIITQTAGRSLTIPNKAILEEQGNYFVLLQLTPELFLKKELALGQTDGIRTEILDGLSAGDRIVDSGAVLVKLSQASGALDPHAGHVH